jgi:hypothetical protein
MKAALILCPFFTNGDYPPLGLASINGALRDAGHETSCFDFSWLAYKEWQGEFHLIRQFFGVGRVEDEVVFVLEPELGLYLLYKEDTPDFSWRLSFDPQVKQAAVMLYTALRQMAPDWADRVIEEKPDAALFSTYASNLFINLYLAKKIRSKKPDLPIIFGGPGVSMPEMQEFVLSAGWVDAAVAGEGELTVSELCADLKDNLESGVPGLALMKDDSVVIEPRPLVKNLDSLPRPDFTGFPMPGLSYEAYKDNRPNKYLTPFFEGLSIAGTRGCVNRCAYCSETAYWSRFRQRRHENVIEEIQKLHDLYGETHFLFNESAFNGNPKWVGKFCEKAQSLSFDPKFCALMIADRSVDDELAKKMYGTGFRHATLGVETFSRPVRERMNKGKSGDELFASILALTRAGINVKANLLVGFPGESQDEFEASLVYMKQWADMPKNDRGPGTLYWDAGHTVRLEAYSEFFHHPEKYSISMSPYEIPLPDSLSHLKNPLSKILRRWSMPLDRTTVLERSGRMRKMA